MEHSIEDFRVWTYITIGIFLAIAVISYFYLRTNILTASMIVLTAVMLWKPVRPLQTSSEYIIEKGCLLRTTVRFADIRAVLFRKSTLWEQLWMIVTESSIDTNDLRIVDKNGRRYYLAQIDDPIKAQRIANEIIAVSPSIVKENWNSFEDTYRAKLQKI